MSEPMLLGPEGIEWVKAYRERTGCGLREAASAWRAQIKMPPSEIERLRAELSASEESKRNVETLLSKEIAERDAAQRECSRLREELRRAEAAFTAIARSRDEWIARCQEKSDDKSDAIQALQAAEARVAALEAGLREAANDLDSAASWLQHHNLFAAEEQATIAAARARRVASPPAASTPAPQAAEQGSGCDVVPDSADDMRRVRSATRRIRDDLLIDCGRCRTAHRRNDPCPSAPPSASPDRKEPRDG